MNNSASSNKSFLKAVIVVGHSCAGKSGICSHLLQVDKKISFSVSATTRPRRENEVNGKDYIFLSTSVFQKFIGQKRFIEHDFQNTGHYYGTLWSELEKINNAGKTCLLDVNPIGADNLINHFGSSAITIFITVPGQSAEEKIEVLRKRARINNIDIRDDFESRMSRVYDELRWAKEREIEHWVENGNLNQACEHVANAVGYAKQQMRKNARFVGVATK